MSNTISITLGGTLIAFAMFSSPAAASPAASVTPVDFTNAAFAPTSGPTSIPIGAADFCKAHRDDCRPTAQVVDAERLSQASWQQLIAINDNVNATVVPETDEDNYHVAEYWTYPANGRGDCEDIALEKRRELVAAGWDPSTLLMTVVREKSGEGHALLMVRTDRGDMMLDNQDPRILLWSDTAYEFVKRQSQADAGKWVALNDDRPMVIAASN
ncbi:MAG: transglutaminase-like cysteine peptidase [Devosia sp.]